MKSFDQLLKEAKRNAQGKRTEEAGASSAKLQASGNLRADAFLKKLGIDRSKYPYTQTKEDVQTFRGKVDELAENTHGILLPSQFRELQSKFPSEYKKLTEEGSDLTSYARSLLNDKQTEMDVFRSNYKLGNIGKQYNTLENRLASFSDDMDYIKATTDGYEDYSKYLRAALSMDDSQLKTDMYTFGKQQNDAGKRTQMTKSELDSEINALVQEITMAKNTQQPAPFDPMGAMGSMGMPAMPTQTTDTSKQEARLAELYGMLERGEYITDEEAKQQKQDYFDRYREDWKAGMDAKDAQIEEAEDILRRGYVSDPNKPLTSEEIDALLDKQESVQAEMDAEVDPYHAIYGKKDWGAYIGSGVMKGFSDFSNALYQTYDVVLGKPIDYIVNAGKSAIEKVFGVDTGADFRNPLSRWADAYQGVNQQYAQEADRATAAMGESAWWKTGQQVIGGLIQNVPNTVLAFMTGGASAGVTGMQDAAVKAMQTAGSSKLMKTVTNMLSNPQYWSSFAQTLGNDYNDAVQESGDPVKSALYAMASSLINAGIEIGLEGDSGIQGLGRAIEEKDIPGFMRVLKAGGDEYTEEVKQGIVSGIAKKVIYDADKPWISATDNNAVISPELAESATVGGLTGMLMGGGAEVSNAAVGAYNNMQEQRAYEREARRVLFGEQPIDEQQTIKDQETQNAKAAEAYFDRASDLTGEETARQYAMSGRSEEELADTLQTVGIEMTDAVRDAYNTAAIEREENVQQRRAEIEALKRPLAKQQNRDDISAVNAEAPVQQSGTETEAFKRPLAKPQNRDDVSAVDAETPAQRMEGQPITKAATSENTAVSAEDAAYRQQVQELNKGGRNGSRKGVLRSISDAEVKKFEKQGIRKFTGFKSDKQRAASDALRKVAETTHINVVLFESPVNADGQHVGANGFYDRNTNTVYLDLFAGKENEQAVMKAAAHEFTHVIQEWSPEKYTQLQDMLVKYYYSTGNTTLRELVQSQIDKAAAVGNTLDEVQAMDEVTADACEMMFGDIDAMREIYNKDRTLFEKIGEWINKFVDSVKAAMQGLRAGTREADLLMQNAQTWENARKLWYQALEEVGQNNPGSVDQTAGIAENVQNNVIGQAQQRTDSGQVQYSLRERYDYTKPFAEQIEDWDSGKDFGNDTLVIGGTPEVLKQIGLVSLPLTMDQSHLRKILGDPKQETRKIKNKDHDLGKDFLKKLPEHLKDPVAVIRDMNEKRNGLVVILGEKNKNADNRAIIGAVKIDGGGSINEITIDANNLKTVHSRDNVLQMLDEAAEAEQKEGYGVYYLNKNKATQLFGPERVPGRVHSLEGGYMHSVADAASPVKSRVKDQTETAQFKRWFKGSKVVNADGTPKVVYNGTPSYGFTVFDKDRIGKGIDQFGAGFYFATDKKAAESYGDKQYEVYLNIRKPIKIERTMDGGDLYKVRITQDQAYQILKKRPGIMDAEESPLGDFVEEYWKEGPKDWMIRQMAKNYQSIGDLDGDWSAFREYPNELHEAIRDVMGYDGVELSFDNTTEKFYVAWFPEQIKSATENIGTFDGNNPDIRYSLRDTEYKTDRELLAAALESAAVTEEEQRMLKEYKQIAAQLDADSERVNTINEKIRELRLEEPNTPEEKQLLEERKNLEKGITNADKKLLKMEAMQPLQRIAKLQRKEAEAALDRAKRHMERYKEGVTQREYIARIKKTSDRLSKWLTKPTNQRYVPEAMRKPLAEFLLAIDRGSETMLAGAGETQADRDYARVVADLRDVLNNINAYQNDQSESDKVFNMHIDLPRGFVEMMTEHARKMEARAAEMGGRMTLNRMTSQELDELFKTLTAISSSITHTNDFLSTENARHVSEVSQETISYLRDQKPVKEEGKLAEFLNWDNTQPIYAFERYGEGGKRIFKMLQNGQSKLAFNTQEIVETAESIYTADEVRQWSEEIKTFEIGGKDVQIPVANIMSLYCLMRRQQGVGHLYGEGIRVGDFKMKGKMVRDDGHNVGDADIMRMIGTLTERQKAVAEQLQRVMSTQGSSWGNEISMKRFGYRMFTERNYFPIEVDRTHLPARTDNGRGNELYRLLNISSTKPITRGANNRIMLNNIFDVFSSHMSDMAQYNAMALPVLDAVKWLNYKESELEEVPLGEEKEYRQKYTESVRDAARDAYGYAANKYIIGVLRDINGAQMTGGTAESFGKMMMGRANRASVAANLRVAFLQPLSIIRAGMVLNAKDIVKGAGIGATRIKKNIEEMQKHSGIAAWKDLGFFDVNIGRSVSKLIKHDETRTDKLIDASMKGAEWADKLTWALMWEGAKQDVARTINPGSKDYMQQVAERFEEVVYKTQVVDSVLTRSQYMRNPSFVAKWTSSFMSEPTTTYNMLLEAYNKFTTEARNTNFQKAWQKNGRFVLRTMSVYTLASALNAVVESLMSAWRDEDDYTTFMEKFTGGLYDNFINNMMPFNKLPLVNDLYEYAKRYLSKFGVDTYGYSDSNSITQWLDQLESGIEIIADKVNGNATNYTNYGAMYKLLQGVSSLTGIPMASFMREATAMWNNTGGYMTGNKIVVYKTNKTAGYKQMYNAILSENTQRANEIKTELLEDGAEEKQIFSGLRSAAKEDYLAGNLSDKEAAAFLHKHCGMSEDEAFWKLEEWGWEAQEEENDYSVYRELEEALLSGESVKDAVQKLTDHGYEDSKVQSKVREIVKEGFLAGDLTQTQTAALLKTYGDLNDNEVYFKQQQYEYERLTGDSTTSDACMIFYAIDNKQSPAKAIDAALKRGKTKSGLASSLTSRYKQQYLQLLKTNKSAAYQLATRLAGVFDYLGYKGTQKVQEWK